MRSKKERKLIADFKKVFANFCNTQECHTCKYDCENGYCEIDYFIDLLRKENKE